MLARFSLKLGKKQLDKIFETASIDTEYQKNSDNPSKALNLNETLRSVKMLALNIHLISYLCIFLILGSFCSFHS